MLDRKGKTLIVPRRGWGSVDLLVGVWLGRWLRRRLRGGSGRWSVLLVLLGLLSIRLDIKDLALLGSVRGHRRMVGVSHCTNNG